MSTRPVIMRLLSAAYCCAERSGVLIKEIFCKGDLGIVAKDGLKDLQTEADRAVQRCVVASLQKRFPQLRIVGEEELEEKAVDDNELIMDDNEEILAKECPAEWADKSEQDFTMWVDPLDGTAEFTEGLLDHCTVLLGISFAGRHVAGVVHQPYHQFTGNGKDGVGRSLWGLTGLGAFGPFGKVQLPAGSNVVTTTRSHSVGAVQMAVDACQPTEVLSVGGAGHKVLLILDGRAHAYVFASPFSKKWDTCAPGGVLEAAGGRLTDVLGHPIGYDAGADDFKNRRGVLATGVGVDFEFYRQRIPQTVAAQMEASLAKKK